MNKKTAFILGIVLTIVSIVALVYAEEIRSVIVSKSTNDYLTAQATSKATTIEQETGSILDQVVQDKILAEQQKQRDALDIQFMKLRAKCREQNKMQECIDAMKTIVEK